MPEGAVIPKGVQRQAEELTFALSLAGCRGYYLVNQPGNEEAEVKVGDVVGMVQFVVGPSGKPTGALVSIEVWQEIVRLLEEAEDQGLIRTYLMRRRRATSPEAMGLLAWDEVQAELDTP